MKSFSFRSFVLLGTAVVVTSCGGEDVIAPPPSPPILTLAVAPDSTAVVAGGTVQMTATVTDENNNPVSGETIIWSTSDVAIAAVDATTGLVTGVAAGTATITATNGTVTATGNVTVVASAAFAADVLPIFTANCAVSGCHVAPTPPQDMDLGAAVAFANIVGIPSMQSGLDRIEPGNPDASYLIHKLRGTQIEAGGSGLQMPRNRTPLTSDLINTIIAWTRSGAPNN